MNKEIAYRRRRIRLLLLAAVAIGSGSASLSGTFAALHVAGESAGATA